VPVRTRGPEPRCLYGILEPLGVSALEARSRI
jgi:hypothetical protein